jgi:hypothetical protein
MLMELNECMEDIAMCVVDDGGKRFAECTKRLSQSVGHVSK